MFRIVFTLFLAVFIGVSGYSQSSQSAVNDYKYVIIPESFSFLKNKDAYQLNSLTKFLFEKYGFNTIMEGEAIPEDLISNGCKALRANVNKIPGLLKTRLTVSLKNCNGQEVYVTKEGDSREKEFKKSYHEALRKAFTGIQLLNYSYTGAKDQANKTESVIPNKERVIESVPTTAAAKKVTNPKEIKNDGPKVYTFNTTKYLFKPTTYGFNLFKESNPNNLEGKIYQSSRGNSFIVKGDTLSGIGYFDAYGNFVLERINPATDKIISDTFARQ